VGESPGGDDLADGRAHGVAQGVALGHIPDAGAVVQVGDRHAEEVDLAAQHRDETEQALDERRLARAVGAEQGHHLTGGQREGHVVDDDAIAVAEGGVTDVDEGRGHWHCWPTFRVARLERMISR
jgi:hypothetical protein